MLRVALIVGALALGGGVLFYAVRKKRIRDANGGRDPGETLDAIVTVWVVPTWMGGPSDRPPGYGLLSEFRASKRDIRLSELKAKLGEPRIEADGKVYFQRTSRGGGGEGPPIIKRKIFGTPSGVTRVEEEIAVSASGGGLAATVRTVIKGALPAVAGAVATAFGGPAAGSAAAGVAGYAVSHA